MLAESFLLYNVIYQGVLKIATPYKNAVIKEENERNNVFVAKDRLATHTGKLALNTSNDCMELEFDTQNDPLGILVGSVVYLTIKEIRYLDSVTNWAEDTVLSLLNHIISVQVVRQILYAQS
jgi:hypothetical protein